MNQMRGSSCSRNRTDSRGGREGVMSLKNDCLGHVPILPSTMQDIYERIDRWSEKELRVQLKAVCLSHERMRAELEGCEVLLAEDAAKIEHKFQATILLQRERVQELREGMYALQTENAELNQEKIGLANQLWSDQKELAALKSAAVPVSEDAFGGPAPRCPKCRGYGKFGGECCEACDGTGMQVAELHWTEKLVEPVMVPWLTLITKTMTGSQYEETNMPCGKPAIEGRP